jgi:hypothetical protein
MRSNPPGGNRISGELVVKFQRRENTVPVKTAAKKRHAAGKSKSRAAPHPLIVKLFVATASGTRLGLSGQADEAAVAVDPQTSHGGLAILAAGRWAGTKLFYEPFFPT